MPSKGEVHTVFTDRVGELASQAEAKGKAVRGQGQRKWGGPEDWSGSPKDIAGLVAPYDRREIDQNYAELIASGVDPGTAGDAVSLKTQSDYVALQERAIRTRYASSARCIGHAAARWNGQGSPKGIFHDGLIRYAQDCIKAGGELMATLADYSGRTYDVAAFQGHKERGEVLLDQTILDGGGMIVTGAAKASQRWVVEFLTERGTVAYRANRGCDFMTKLRLGYLRHESDVFAAFALAAADVDDGLAGEESESTPDDERIASSSLTRVQIFPGYCKLHVNLTTVAGPRRAVILPIATS